MVGSYHIVVWGLFIFFGYTNIIKDNTNDFLKDTTKWMTELAQLQFINFPIRGKTNPKKKSKEETINMERVSYLLFFRWNESRGCLYERGCFILDLLPSCSFLRLSAFSADHGYPIHCTKNSVRKITLFQQPTSLLMQINTAPSYILISHSTAVQSLASSLVQLRDKCPKKITFRSPLLTEGILLSIFFVTMYICFFMKTEEFSSNPSARIGYLDLTGPVQCINWLYVFLTLANRKFWAKFVPSHSQNFRALVIHSLCYPNT